MGPALEYGVSVNFIPARGGGADYAHLLSLAHPDLDQLYSKYDEKFDGNLPE